VTELAVVLITKNQAWNVSRLIDSVLKHTSSAASREIILVDSASSDATVERACEYPIRVLRLSPDQRLTAAAGRYTGYKHTTGDVVLFLDGDHELCPGWLEVALEELWRDPSIGAVAGEIVDRPKSTRPHDPPPDHPTGGDIRITEVRHGGPAAIYKRSVLEQVGTFNPYLYSDEEPELCIRIRHAGYRVVRINRCVAYHYTDPSDKLSTLVGRWKRNLYLGSGQNIRYHAGTSLLWPYIKERGHGIIPGLVIVAELASLAWALCFREVIWFALLNVAVIATVVAYTIRKRSVYRTVHSVLKRMLTLGGTIKGFLLEPLEPESYPANVMVIK